MRRIILLVVLPVVVLGIIYFTNGKGGGKLSEADKALIKKSSLDLLAKMNQTRDYAAFVESSYAEEAKSLTPNAEPLVGRKEIVKFFTSSPNPFTMTITINDIDGHGDLAYVYGNYNIDMGNGARDYGKYIEIRKKQQDGSWKVIYDIFNTSVPLPADTTAKH